MQRTQAIILVIGMVMVAGLSIGAIGPSDSGPNDLPVISFMSAGCFISASLSEFAGIGAIFILCLVGLVIGLRLIFDDSADDDMVEKAK